MSVAQTQPDVLPAPEDLEVVKRRHPVRWAAAIIILVLAVMLGISLANNDNIEWSVIGDYVTDGAILHGVWVTLYISVIAQVIGIVLGIGLAVLRLSGNPVLTSASGLYVWFFRGTPQLVQLIFWFNFAILFPTLVLGIPFTDAHVFSAETNTIITPLMAAILGLGLNEGAYYSEIVRGGILSVHPGQVAAASALGMTFGQTMRKIVLPQAMRVIIPPTGNDFITMLKTSALVSVIGGSELLSTSRDIYARSFQVIELLIVASIWYLVLTSIASTGQYFLERHYARGSGVAPQQQGVLLSIVRHLTRWRVARTPAR